MGEKTNSQMERRGRRERKIERRGGEEGEETKREREKKVIQKKENGRQPSNTHLIHVLIEKGLSVSSNTLAPRFQPMQKVNVSPLLLFFRLLPSSPLLAFYRSLSSLLSLFSPFSLSPFSLSSSLCLSSSPLLSQLSPGCHTPAGGPYPPTPVFLP